MRSGILAAVLVGVLVCGPAGAGTDTPDVARFRQLRAEGVAAASAGDLATAAEKLDQAAAILPTHVAVIVFQAMVAAARGHPSEAAVHLSRYASMGLTADFAADPRFAETVLDPAFAPVQERLVRNRMAVGAPSPLLRDEGLHLLEGLAFWSGRDEVLVSSIRGRTIYRLAGEGGLQPYLEAPERLGIYGLAIDQDRDRLWAACAGSSEAGVGDEDAGRTELVEIELSSGRVVARHSPPHAERRGFGDVAVAFDGTVAVSDSVNGDVFLFRPGMQALEPLIGPGVFGSPQGMVFSADAGLLLIADYTSGLYRIDLRTGEVSPVAMPEDLTLIATDGLALSEDGAVWLVQNGVSPNRVMRLELTPGWREIVGVTVEAANLAEMNQPSGLTMGANAVLLIQQSQWGRFDASGQPRADRTDAAVISALPLTRQRH